ncbi:MAG: YitT family protein [Clostridia bacterium]|nr:YitT family protein [Clostridia bacterium]
MKSKEIKKYILAILGGVIVGIGVGLILLPLKLSTGGLSGVSTLLYYLLDINAGITTLILNIPLFIIAIKMFGVNYSVRTLCSMGALSIALMFMENITPLTSDLFLASIFGGGITGIGLAFAVMGEATTGGTDLIAKIIQTKRQHLNMGEILLIIDGIIIAVSAFTFESIEVALYSAIAVFTMTKIMDVILEGRSYSKALYIITDKADEISDYIITEVGRGATKLKGTGAYSGEEKGILLCVASKNEIPHIKNKVREIDKKCFMIVTNVAEAIGEGFITEEGV